MSRYRKLKERLKIELEADTWKEFIERLATGSGELDGSAHVAPPSPSGNDAANGSTSGNSPADGPANNPNDADAWLAQVTPSEALGPLMGFLPGSGSLRWRAACAIGMVTAKQAETPTTREKARVTMRRFMWHMNEESGNIGWGIPESMAETLVRSASMAEEFSHILFSYIIDTGNDDNYIEHPPLLAACFWAAGRLAEERPDLAGPHFRHISAGLEHYDPQVTAQACLALHKLARATGGKKTWLELETGQKNLIRDLVNKTESRLQNLKKSALECEDFDGHIAVTRKVAQLADELLWGAV